MDLQTFLREEVKPALGCTEPGAVALAASSAARYLIGEVKHIHLRLSASIFKNGSGVGIPGTKGLRGNLLAAALGAIAGNPEEGLQALARIKPGDIEKAQELLSQDRVTQEVVPDVPNVYAEVELEGDNVAAAIIAWKHDRLVEIWVDGNLEKRLLDVDTSIQGRPGYLETLVKQDMASLWRLAGSIDSKQEEFLLSGSAMNEEIAGRGYEKPWGLGIGYYSQKNAPADNLFWKVRAMAGAAADVRMAGGPYPVMSSAGSGNHGLTAILPVAVTAAAWDCTRRQKAEALALSHLVTGYSKAHTGRLTSICGCSVAAGAGAAAGIVYLAGGTPKQGEGAVNLLISSLLGMICDGAKGTCALKVATAAGEAYNCAQLALSGRIMTSAQGVVFPSLQKTANSVGVLSRTGFAAVDSVILQLMGGQD